MGVLNVTPDSFFDGGHFDSLDRALEQAHLMAEAGASIIDVGGESTRPGADPLPVEEELSRVMPVIERLHETLDVVISIDTMKPEVMRAAVDAGAGLINDINALRAPGALDAAAACRVPVCLMHMQGNPRTMQKNPHYDDVVVEVRDFLLDRARACIEAGIPPSQIVIDPGFGFGKTLEHNLRLFAHLHDLCRLDYPVLVGVSRKSMIGGVLHSTMAQRLHGGIGAAAVAVWEGATIIRTHDVAETRDAVAVASAVRACRDGG